VSAFSEHVFGKGERLLTNCKFSVVLFKVGDVCDAHCVLKGDVSEMAGHVLLDNN